MHIAYLNLICLVGSLLSAVLCTPVTIRLARSLGIFDLPGLRKVHKSPVPRIGGLAIAISSIVPCVIAVILAPAVVRHVDHTLTELTTLLIASFSLMVIGLVDDIYNIRAQYKLLVLLAASVLFCGSGGVIRTVSMGGHELFSLGNAAWPVTILWLVAVTVSINFVDGLDGLAAGIVAVACFVFAVGASINQFPLSVLLALSLMGSLCGFLVFNKYPAKIFMGDCGSMFIGFTLAGLCAMSNSAIGTTRSLILPALALSVPLCDLMFTMVRRGVLQRRSLFAPERGHIHHRLLDSGLWHPHAVWMLHGVTLVAGLLGMVSIFGTPWAVTISSLVYTALLIGFFRHAGSVRARDTVNAVRKNRAIARENARFRSAFYDMQLAFREVQDFDGWWKQMIGTAELFDFVKMNLPVSRRDGEKLTLRWRRDENELAASDSLTAEFPIQQRRANETLRVEVEAACSKFPENNCYRLSLFTQLIGEHGLDRIPDRPKSVDYRADAPVDDTTSTAVPAITQPTVGPFSTLRVAIVHDFLYTYAGAERVLEQLVEVFPHADLFSLFDFLPQNQRGFIRNKPVHTSFLQKMPFARRSHRKYLPLMPLAIEQMDVSGYDLVISSSYIAAKGILTRADQMHICYCHTPARYAWDLQATYLKQTNMTTGIRSSLARAILHYIRGWDVRSSMGVDHFITNSNHVGQRIRKLYRRPSTTIYPPVDVDAFALYEDKEDYYLTASRLVPYKRVDLIVEAFAKMPDRRLIVVGDGPEMQAIKLKATPNVTFTGHESQHRLRRHMQLAKAFIFAAEEDFGIVPVEAQACGTPVIAFNRGGVTESVIDGKTGVFFSDQSAQSIVDAIDRFEKIEWNPRLIRAHAEQFSAARFRERITRYVRRHWTAFMAERIRQAVPAIDGDVHDIAAQPHAPPAPGAHDISRDGGTDGGTDERGLRVG